MQIITALANKANYGNQRNTSSIKYIVIHYTGNDGDTDSNNAKYFQTAGREASAHYFVDDDSVTQSVPDDYVAWHCGISKGGTYYHPTCRNANSIGIEMCDAEKNGVYNLTEKTRANVIELVKYLMAKYNIPISNVVRHYDVTHKKCPAYFVDENAWAQFKIQITGDAVASLQPTATQTVQTVQAQPVQESIIDVVYKVFAGKWYSDITNYDENANNGNGYAGVENKAISGLMAKLSRGKIKCRVHSNGDKWYGWVDGYNTDDVNNGFAGVLGKNIDAVQMQLVDLPGYHVEYRVSNIGSTGYLGWIRDFNEVNGNGYAGIFGKNIDKIQIRIVKG